MPESDQATIVADDPTATIPTTEAAGDGSPPEVPSDAGDTPGDEPEDMGEITEVVLDDLGGMSLSDAIDATLVSFDEGGLVTGTVVKIDSDEVLLDIGFKSEGVIPSKELSIRNDVNPSEIVTLGE